MPRPISRRAFLKRLITTAGSAALGGCRPGPIAPAPTPSGEVARITILHLNDFHGALHAKQEDGGDRGGAANLVGLSDRMRAKAPGPVLFLDAGDAFQGTYVSNSNRGQAMVELMNLSGLDAFALGNHEFDWGTDVLMARIEEAHFPCLAANLETASGEMLRGVEPYAVIDAGGIKVGVLGLTYHDLKTIVKASAIEGLRSLPPVETVRRYLPELEAKADLVIVLCHLGLDGDRALAKAVPEIPIIVGGHTHQALHSGEKIGSTLIAQAGAYGEYLGQVVVAFDPVHERVIPEETTARLLQVTDAGTPSASAKEIVARWGREADRVGSQVIGEAAIPLRKKSGAEMALGNLIVDAMRAADLGDGQAFDIAVHNDGGIRADLETGPITYAEAYAVLPFDNSLVGIDLSGAQVRELLEEGIDDQGTRIQVSGLTLTYSLNKARGRRAVDVTVGGEKLDPEHIYRVVTIDYMLTHPAYRLSLGQGTHVTYGGLCLDAVIEYIRAHSPVEPRVEGRMRRI